MRYPAAETAQKHVRILDEATRLFGDKGFDGVSIPELMKSSGLTHGSFYNHFRSKDSLFSECILYGSRKSIADMSSQPTSTQGQAAYIDAYLAIEHRDDPGTGCLMAALGSETRRHALAQDAMTRFVRSFIDKLSTHFPWSRRTRARRDAIRVTAALVGGMILSRAVDDEALSLEILHEVAEGLKKSYS